MKKFHILCPGWVYAGTFYGNTAAEVRAACRRWMGVVRLPRGTAVWES